jgi:hypothetical protein
VKKHQAEGSEPWSFSPNVYRALRRRSQILMFACMAASGWLLARCALTAMDDAGPQVFGPDILIAGAVLLLWGWTMVGLFRPPSEVVASTQHTSGDGPLVIMSLGVGMRFWNVVTAPFGGVVFALMFLLFEMPESTTEETDSSADLIAVIVVAALAVYVLATLWMISRSILQGAELTGSELVVHGFFRTRRFERDLITKAEGKKIHWLADIIFSSMHLDINRTVQLSLRDGRQLVLHASSGGGSDYGAAVINEWLAASGGEIIPRREPGTVP